MVDTGNMLKEPITGTPVVVVERTSLYELLPKEILNNTEAQYIITIDKSFANKNTGFLVIRKSNMDPE